MQQQAIRQNGCPKLKLAFMRLSLPRTSQFILLVSIFIAASAYAAERVQIVHESFVLELPLGWALLNRDGRREFENYNFYNARSDVIQFSVSKELRPNVHAKALKNLQAGAREDQSKIGWKLVRTNLVKLPRFGDVEERIYADVEMPLTSYFYGESRIALFTITFNRSDFLASEAAQVIVNGFRWK